VDKHLVDKKLTADVELPNKMAAEFDPEKFGNSPVDFELLALLVVQQLRLFFVHLKLNFYHFILI
jgi:hypothetical protein